jgi:cytochrome c5
MKRRRGSSFLLLTAVSVTAWLSAGAQQGSTAGAAKATKSPVHEITLPDVTTEMPAGPNLAVYQNHCVLCHSSRYVAMQPRFSKAVWEKEVKKMVDVYGAPITSDDQAQIVEYLVAIRGPADSK